MLILYNYFKIPILRWLGYCFHNPIDIKCENHAFKLSLPNFSHLIFEKLWYLYSDLVSNSVHWAIKVDSLNYSVLYIQFSLVAQLYPTLFDPMDCSIPGFPVHHQLPGLTQIHVHWVRDAIQPSHPLLSPSPHALKSFPASGSFPVSQLFASSGQSTGASVSASVLPMNSQGWFPF